MAITDLANLGIFYILDWPKSEFATYLFGGSEPPDRPFTKLHEFVIIDSELMFASGPCEFDMIRWWNEPDGSPSYLGRNLAFAVCIEVAALSESQFQDALHIPTGIYVSQLWSIAPKLNASRRFAGNFVKAYERGADLKT